MKINKMKINKLVIFDVDGTLFKTTGANFILHGLQANNYNIRFVALKQLILSPLCTFLYLFVNMSWAVKVLIYAMKGCSELEYSNYMSSYNAVKIDPVCHILKKHMNNPNTLVITITASPKVCLSTQLVKIGIKKENQYGPICISDSQGFYTGDSKMLVDGHTKKQIVKKIKKIYNLNQKDLYFYTDSFQDLPLLKYAGHSYLVKPNFFMKYIAKLYNFKIIY